MNASDFDLEKDKLGLKLAGHSSEAGGDGKLLSTVGVTGNKSVAATPLDLINYVFTHVASTVFIYLWTTALVIWFSMIMTMVKLC